MRRKWHVVYPEGIPYEVEIPTDVSIYDSFEKAVNKSPSSIAIIDEELVMTYSELQAATERLAKYFHKQGMGKGDHVAVMLPILRNTPCATLHFKRIGCTQVQVNILYQSSELSHILNDSEAKWIVCDDSQVSKLKAIELQREIEQIVFDAEKNLFQQVCFHDEATASVQLPNVPIHPMEDVAIIQYTGGTTGHAKGVMLTHYKIVGYVIQNRVFYSLKEKEEVTLGNTPMAHIMGIGYLNLTIALSGTYIVMERFNIQK